MKNALMSFIILLHFKEAPSAVSFPQEPNGALVH